MREQVLNWIVTKQEKFLGARLDYLREVARLSTAAFLKMALIAPLAKHRRALPRAAYHLAVVTATKQEDCGPCVQIAVNLAKKEHVPMLYLRAALEGRYSELPGVLGDVCQFAEEVAHGAESSDLREKIREHYGDAAVVELAFAISTARVYPTLKRAMGYAQSCAVTRVEV